MILTSDFPLDLRLTVTSGQLFHWSEEKGKFKILQDKTVFLVRQTSSTQIKIKQTGREVNRNEIIKVLGLIPHRPEAMKRLEVDPLFSPFALAYRGLTIMRQHPYECLISFMASAVSNIPRIMQNLRDLRTQSGTPITGTQEKSFPLPEQIIEMGESGLRQIGLGYRARFIFETCTKIKKGGVQLDHWTNKSTPELTEALTGFPGVGKKIAECTALFGFGRWDAFPVDVWVKRALLTLDPKLNGMSADDLCQWGKERWGSNAGLAQQILFCAARDGEIPC
ncbi:MAG: hypothetical protein CMG71_05665 [Candidatus Marinimicrobia bacterium]|nr:hypothetical protein [Candidatus Neomarinimicrobiota bacterium]|tara:strand:+ start:4199 stop:5038 length:840 start_codon:yes stop_codon:yes gene_type:complete